MKGATLFSGIGAPEVACPEIDWRWCAEHDSARKRGHGFAARVHEVRHGIPNLGDVNKVNFNDQPKIDVLVFGSPCQSFSVAGKRAGLDDPRGNMALIGLSAARQLGVEWLVFENVPGFLSSASGRDFGLFLEALGQLGYGFAYRVLDAQYTGVPQRRRRIILVGHLGDWRRAAAVLFEPGGLRRDPAPRRQARAHVAAPLAASPAGGSGWRADADTAENHVVCALSAHPGPHGRLDASVETLITHTLRADGFDASEDGTGRGTSLVFNPAQITSPHNRAAVAPGGVAPSLAESGHAPTLAFANTLQHNGIDQNGESNASAHKGDAEETLRALRDEVGAKALAKWGLGILRSLQSPKILQSALHGVGVRRAAREAGLDVVDSTPSCPESMSSSVLRKLWEDGPDGCSSSGQRLAQQLAREFGAPVPFLPHQNSPRAGTGVRRLTPRECERLMGFPDDFTAIEWRGKPAPDGPRYRALGNSMAVPVMRWVLRRLQRVHSISREEQ